MAANDAVETLIHLTRYGEIENIRIEAVRSLAAYLDDERTIKALRDLTRSGGIRGR